ncbi:hypothetical protein IMG5_021010 [Ichthyophthirius multifiliis]|uniref:Histidine--tRNA ligase, cytoplasmic n=1 Tax=Ichthyophthirius multifiliis TaxID=5932 RepID=G0QKR4_ICHMU|nr:hypothetical protein IMG5_021010 [Ichthyophthirius multifiliis]EGR34186.1 hypothetical protein IMG5_021010 [Ichthyophthirius multifiliis]|eukprot:XP_004039490.1 hypothetical protein IMG5_021010 [Ichthyophthirius multifiliis]
MNYLNTENILKVAGEKRSIQRNLTTLSSELFNLLFASKLSKNKPQQEVIQGLELIAITRNNIQTLLDFVYDQLQIETSENQQNLQLNNDDIKQYFALNSLLLNILNSFNLQVQNTQKRLELLSDLDDLFKSDLNQQKQQNQELFKSLIFQQYTNTTRFGENISYLLSFESHLNNFLSTIQSEFFISIQSLEKLNRKLNSNPSKVPIKDDKKPKKDTKKLQMGKGTDQIFFQINSLFDLTNSSSFESSRDYFSPQNTEFLHKIDEILTLHNQEHRKPKIPKGTRDFTPLQMAIRRKAFQIIQETFLKHGAVEIDTPVFELKETLTGKYGNDSKLIYDLDDQGGELLSLRYDLTVPFARYMANQAITNFKRFHIAKVYRRDQPNMTKGRYREFYQCDFDIAGVYDPMLPDAEVLKVIGEILSSLKLGADFKIKVNSRKLLDAMIQISGAPVSKFKQICSSIDKLDKEQWKEVRRELIEDKGIPEKSVEKLGEFVKYTGNPLELLKQIEKDGIFNDSKIGLEGLKEMGMLFSYLQAMNALHYCVFDLSLARGLDYYTGVIYEAVLEGAQIGSIAGGGRYDELIGMFSNKQIPAVGGSIGIERIMNILEEQYTKLEAIRNTETQVLVCTVGQGLCLEKLKLTNELWDRKFKAEIIYSEKPKPQKQLSYALENQIPFMIWIGDEELKGGFVKLKCTYLKSEENIQRNELLDILQQKLDSYYTDLLNGKVIFEKEAKENKE